MYQITMNQVRRTGLEVLGERPWGTHFCVFYETESDLVEMLTPYFRTGIDNNERCFWVLAGSVRRKMLGARSIGIFRRWTVGGSSAT